MVSISFYHLLYFIFKDVMEMLNGVHMQQYYKRKEVKKE